MLCLVQSELPGAHAVLPLRFQLIFRVRAPSVRREAWLPPEVARVIRRTAAVQRDQVIFLVIAQPSAVIPVVDLRAL